MISWPIIWILCILVGALICFIWEKWPVDLTAIGVFTLLVGTSLVVHSPFWPTLDELLQVFASPAPLTIAGMFVLSAALEYCGVIERIADIMNRASAWPYAVFLGLFTAGVGLISAFVNNTVVVVVLMPVILGLTRKGKKPPSKFLIPLSYASIFGGCCTAIGTSTNILAGSFLQSAGYENFKMFELAYVGLPAFALGWLYLILFSDRLLPARETFSHLLTKQQRREYLAQARVRADSRLVGVRLKDCHLLKTRGIRLIEIVRHHQRIIPQPDALLQAGDLLVLACRPSGLAEAHHWEGVRFPLLDGLDLDQIVTQEGFVVEGIVGQQSEWVGQSIRAINQNPMDHFIIVGLHRRGEPVREHLEDQKLEFGDILLVMGTRFALDNLRKTAHILFLDLAPVPTANRKSKQPLIVAIVAAVVGLAAFEYVPILGAIIIGIFFLLALGLLPIKNAYQAIDWRVLSLLYGMLALGVSMDKTGFVQWIAQGWVSFAQEAFPSDWVPHVLLFGIYLGTMVLTELLSNNATIMLMGPIAIELAEVLGFSAYPFVVAACVASSAGFMIPTGYQTHTYIYGVGGYKFRDFFKMGWPLNLMYLVLSLWIIPHVWPYLV